MSFDRDSGVLTVATPGSQGNPLLTKSEQAADLVKYRVSENGIEKINDKAEGVKNGHENQNGTVETRAGDEGGAKGERGKRGEGDGKESAIDGGTAQEVAAGERGRGGAVGEGAKIESSQDYRDWLKANGKNDNASMRRAYANEAVRKLTDLFGKAFRSMGFGEGAGKRQGLKFSFVDKIEDAKSGGDTRTMAILNLSDKKVAIADGYTGGTVCRGLHQVQQGSHGRDYGNWASCRAWRRLAA